MKLISGARKVSQRMTLRGFSAAILILVIASSCVFTGIATKRTGTLQAQTRVSDEQIDGLETRLANLESENADLRRLLGAQGLSGATLGSRLSALESAVATLAASASTRQLKSEIDEVKSCLVSLRRAYNDHSHSESNFGFSQLRSPEFGCFL